MKPPTPIHAKAHLADALKSLAALPKNEGGRISWESGKLERGTFEVIYSLTVNPPAEDHVKDGAVWHVLNECARANDFSTAFFLRRLRAFIAAHFTKQPKPLVAVSQINANFGAGLPEKIPSPLGPIEIKTALPKSDSAVIAKLEDYERDRLGFQSDFLYLTCRVTSTDDRSAIDAAYRKTKYVLGVLNLIADEHSKEAVSVVSETRSPSPKFSVVIGPLDRGCCQVTYRLGPGKERSATLTLNNASREIPSSVERLTHLIALPERANANERIIRQNRHDALQVGPAPVLWGWGWLVGPGDRTGAACARFSHEHSTPWRIESSVARAGRCEKKCDARQALVRDVSLLHRRRSAVETFANAETHRPSLEPKRGERSTFVTASISNYAFSLMARFDHSQAQSAAVSS